MLGKLTLEALPLDQPVIMGAFGFMGLVAFSVVAILTYLGRWKWLWTEWLTSVDHTVSTTMTIPTGTRS
jgi:cytochrome o ubiquinol oxidase subunit I